MIYCRLNYTMPVFETLGVSFRQPCSTSRFLKLKVTLPQESNKFQPADVNLTRHRRNRERERERNRVSPFENRNNSCNLYHFLSSISKEAIRNHT